MPPATSAAPSSIRHELTQCQNCWVSKGPGITFSRCSRCKVDIYCSKECQKAAWPTHKTKCQLNSRISAHGGLELYEAKLKTLRAFTSKHRPTLCECGVRALELGARIENAETQFFLVCVRERPGAIKPELAYVVEDAYAQPYSSLPAPMVEEMQAVRREMNRINVEQEGLDGTFFVVLLDMDSGVRNNAPVGFAREATYRTRRPFRELLFRNLNNGITM